METLTINFDLAKVDLVSPNGAGIERSATMAEIRAALMEFRERHGELPWKMLLAGGATYN